MRIDAFRLRGPLALVVLFSATAAFGGQHAPAQAERANVDAVSPVPIHGPPAPVAPAVVARDAQGRVTVRAVRLEAPLRVDGKLDDQPGSDRFIVYTDGRNTEVGARAPTLMRRGVAIKLTRLVRF